LRKASRHDRLGSIFKETPMPSTFVLVHGAWQGGWVWGRFADRLRAQGHTVFAPTLTGLGERSHLRRDDVNATTHMTDVVNVIRYERLDGIVLVGHSYGGNVISGVAEIVPERIASMVFVDAFIPDNGDAVVDLVAPALKEAILAAAVRGDTTAPVRNAAAFNVNEKDRAWVDALSVPQPIGAMIEKLKLSGARERIANKTYIRASGYPNISFDAAFARAKAEGWRTYAVPCGHNVMIDARM
jgi:pimeloyl-ACP methyl ester carboxylesterase